jgi:hypothetical protein
LPVADHVEAVDANGSFARSQVAGEDAQDGGFTRAVGTKQAHHFPLVHLEGDAVHGAAAAEAFAQPFDGDNGRRDAEPRRGSARFVG